VVLVFGWRKADNMHTMVIGATDDRDYKFPVSILKYHGFEPGDTVEFIGNGDGSLIAKKKQI